VPVLIRNLNAPDMISKTQMNILKEILQILSPLEKVSKEICGEKYLTASKIIPIINCLRKQLENLTPISEGASAIKNIAIFELSKRFGAIEQVKLLSLSTLLDPRFKKIHFNSPIACSQAITIINEMYKESFIAKEIEQESQPSTSFIGKEKENVINKSLWTYHEELASKSKCSEKETMESSGFCLEIKCYINSSVISFKDDPIEYWQLQSNQFLKQIALKHLSIVGTSVPSERLFSKAGLIMIETRNHLLGKRLSKLLFLSSLELDEWY